MSLNVYGDNVKLYILVHPNSTSYECTHQIIVNSLKANKVFHGGTQTYLLGRPIL